MLSSVSNALSGAWEFGYNSAASVAKKGYEAAPSRPDPTLIIGNVLLIIEAVQKSIDAVKNSKVANCVTKTTATAAYVAKKGIDAVKNCVTNPTATASALYNSDEGKLICGSSLLGAATVATWAPLPTIIGGVSGCVAAKVLDVVTGRLTTHDYNPKLVLTQRFANVISKISATVWGISYQFSKASSIPSTIVCNAIKVGVELEKSCDPKAEPHLAKILPLAIGVSSIATMVLSQKYLKKYYRKTANAITATAVPVLSYAISMASSDHPTRWFPTRWLYGMSDQLYSAGQLVTSGTVCYLAEGMNIEKECSQGRMEKLAPLAIGTAAALTMLAGHLLAGKYFKEQAQSNNYFKELGQIALVQGENVGVNLTPTEKANLPEVRDQLLNQLTKLNVINIDLPEFDDLSKWKWRLMEGAVVTVGLSLLAIDHALPFYAKAIAATVLTGGMGVYEYFNTSHAYPLFILLGKTDYANNNTDAICTGRYANEGTGRPLQTNADTFMNKLLAQGVKQVDLKDLAAFRH